MALTKPQRQDDFSGDFPSNKKFKKLSQEIQIGSSSNCTRLEDFPNELFFEIFKYLDVYDIYQGFSSLNIRLHNLLHDPAFPLKINLSLITNSNFEQFNRQLIVPNRHRIQTLHISNLFFVDSIFSPIDTLKEFHRLETIVFNNVKPNDFSVIFHHLTALNNLTTLIIISDKCLDNIFDSIFRLPKLKYCTIKLPSWILLLNISLDTKRISSIEHFFIDDNVRLNVFVSLPTCLPLLKTLHIQSLIEPRYPKYFTNADVPTWHHLKKIQIDDLCIDFEQFELISRQALSQVEVLRLSTSYEDEKYVDARRWENLISNYMLKLRIFDFEYRNQLYSNNDKDSHVKYQDFLHMFSSQFWIERKWFFDYRFYKEANCNKVMFYSVKLKRKQCVFYENLTKYPEANYAEYINIANEDTMLNCKNYFLHAAQLTLSAQFDNNTDSLSDILTNLMPVKQLTSLTIGHQCNMSIKQLIDLLNAMPNIQTLHFNRGSNKIDDHTDIQQSEIFRNVAKNNQISRLTISSDYELEVIKLFVSLCPQIKGLTIERDQTPKCDEIIQYLISNRQTSLPKLCLLHLKNIGLPVIDCSKTLIKISDLLDNCYRKIIGCDLYICF